MLARLRQAFKAIAPIIEAAEAAHDDEAGSCDNTFDIEVDRHGMTELLEAREPQAWKRFSVLRPTCRERGKVAVAKGQNDDVGRRLRKIDGCFDLVQCSNFGRKQVHVLY